MTLLGELVRGCVSRLAHLRRLRHVIEEEAREESRECALFTVVASTTFRQSLGDVIEFSSLCLSYQSLGDGVTMEALMKRNPYADEV